MLLEFLVPATGLFAEYNYSLCCSQNKSVQVGTLFSKARVISHFRLFSFQRTFFCLMIQRSLLLPGVLLYTASSTAANDNAFVLERLSLKHNYSDINAIHKFNAHTTKFVSYEPHLFICTPEEKTAKRNQTS